MTDAFSAIVETGDFRISALIKNDDEFGVTIRAFNKLVESFTGIITAVSTSSARLSQSSQGLTSTTQEIYDAIGNQSVNIGQVAAASMEMTKSVSLISNNSARIDKAANDARAIAESGAEVVAMTCAEVQEIAQVVMESTQVMNELSERSQQVGDIVDVIVDITDQTNLLALNAAIEAARAGDHGRGFAVVADEVRKLANRAAEAAVGITERIKSIQNDTEKAVSTMSTSMERVSRGVGYSRQAGDSLRNIVDSVIHLKEMTAEISSATVELADTSKDISTDIIAVEKSSSETIKAAAHIAGESDKLAMLAVELKDEISRYTYHEAQSMFSARRLDDKNEKTGHNLGMKPATGTPLHSLTFSPAA
jgi:methyl-accepting chemotaxis protein